jgi:hypothetical protein
MQIKTSIAGITVVATGLIAAYGCIAPQPQRGAAPANPPPPPAGAGEFVETFDSPAGFTGRFVTQVFHGALPAEIQTWQGDHDDHCGAPTTSRTISVTNPPASFYWCGPTGPASGHIMTSMLTTGYAEVDFSPNQPIVNTKKVCWDQNQTDLGNRKWTQVVVVPEATYQQNGQRLNYKNPQEGNQEGDIPITSDTFMFVMLRGSTQTYTGQSNYDSNFDGFTTSDKARRFRNCITDLENGTVRIELERESTTETRVLRGAMPNGAARVIFQDETYDAPKDPAPVPNPTTWHWDNIAITT